MRVLTALLVLFPTAVAASAQDAPLELPREPVLTLEAAEEILAAAQDRAYAGGWNMVVAIVDDGGQTVLMARMDGAQLGSVEIALEKARAAVRFRRPTAETAGWVDATPRLIGLPGIVPVAGGVPLWAKGHLVGAVGVSGASAAEDAVVAEAAAAVLSPGVRNR